jgi:phage terminase large subunit
LIDGIAQIEFPRKMLPLLSPARYKILYGGRGGIKSHSIARALLVQGAKEPLRILCARELMKSIKDSVHRLLSDLITQYHLQSYYTVQNASIKGKNGSEFFFEGLRHNAAQIKSNEGGDRVWIEEAATVSKTSWDYLIPTIRKENSEIWISLNPELEEDETYQRFIVSPPDGAVVIKTSWRDNRWFPDVLKQEMATCKARSEEDYLNIWEGQCRQTIEGAVYARELAEAREHGRITSVPYDKRYPVHTFWDLGYADYTSIWFVQKVGFEYRVIDFYQNHLRDLDHYVQVLDKRGYSYGTDYLPHDGRAKQLGTGKSIEEILTTKGRRVDIAPRLSITDGLNSVRMVFNAIYFDASKCADGLQALRRYRYDKDAETQKTSKEPLHDDNSHAADALKTFATMPNIQWDVIVDRAAIEHDGGGKLKHDYDPYAQERI